MRLNFVYVTVSVNGIVVELEILVACSEKIGQIDAEIVEHRAENDERITLFISYTLTTYFIVNWF